MKKLLLFASWVAPGVFFGFGVWYGSDGRTALALTFFGLWLASGLLHLFLTIKHHEH